MVLSIARTMGPQAAQQQLLQGHTYFMCTKKLSWQARAPLPTSMSEDTNSSSRSQKVSLCMTCKILQSYASLISLISVQDAVFAPGLAVRSWRAVPSSLLSLEPQFSFLPTDKTP